MSKRVIRLTESELKNYIRKVISEQGSYNPTGYESDINGDNNTPKQTGEPTVPFEKKGPSVPSASASISSEILAGKIADIEKMKKSANFLQFIKTYGHTSKESWDAAMAGGYAPYASPQLKAQAQKVGYFPYTNMEEKRKETAKYNVGPNASLISNLKGQLTNTGFKSNGNNAFVGKVGKNNASIVFTDKGVTVAKKSAAPQSINGKGMGLIFKPLVMDYSRINATTFKKQVMDYLNK